MSRYEMLVLGSWWLAKAGVQLTILSGLFAINPTLAATYIFFQGTKFALKELYLDHIEQKYAPLLKQVQDLRNQHTNLNENKGEK